MAFYLIYALSRIAGGVTQFYNEREKWKNENLLICIECKAENPIGSKFCGSCRSINLIDRPNGKKVIKNKSGEDLKQKCENINWHRRNKQAQDYFNKCCTYSYCIHCNTAQEAAFKYCNICGEQGRPIPRYILLEWMKYEFPDIIANYDDFNKLKSYIYPYDITFGKIAVAGAQTVSKLTFKAMKSGGKSVLKEIYRKHVI